MLSSFLDLKLMLALTAAGIVALALYREYTRFALKRWLDKIK